MEVFGIAVHEFGVGFTKIKMVVTTLRNQSVPPNSVYEDFGVTKFDVANANG